MLAWLAENAATIAISLVLLGVLGAITGAAIRRKIKGNSFAGCKCGCSQCAMSGLCHKDK